MIVMAHMASAKIVRAISRLHPARRPWGPAKMRESLGEVEVLVASGRISDKGASLRERFFFKRGYMSGNLAVREGADILGASDAVKMTSGDGG
jgi:hypothetical protein